MTRKNHIKKKNDVKREQCIQERLNFLIEDAIAKSNFFMNNWEINIIEIIIGDIIYDISL